MPELPEVETMRRDLEREVVGRRIERAQVTQRPTLTVGRGDTTGPGVLRIWEARTGYGNRATDLAVRLDEQRMDSIGRRGKYLLISLESGETLMIHLGMSGRIQLTPQDAEREKHLFLTLALDDGRELRLSDARGFGEARMLTPAEMAALDRRLGPEPLSTDFTADYLAEQLARRKALIKPLLLNQTVVAGLGNIYVDESLWGARIHPLRRANTMIADESLALHDAIVEVIDAAVERRGTTFSDFRDLAGDPGLNGQYLWAYHRGECSRCGSKIEMMRVGGRGTSFCPACQRLDV
jgi:formamidopyrimidine-DNA glycosylase